MQVVLILILAIAVVICGPIATIWALNTLFPVLAIPFTLDTWLAAFLLGGALTGASFSKK